MNAKLYKRGGIYYIDSYKGRKRQRVSTKTKDKNQALLCLAQHIMYLAKHTDQEWNFNQAANHYLQQCTKKTKRDDISQLKQIKKYLGKLKLSEINQSTPQLHRFIKDRKKTVKIRTINKDLKLLKHILRLTATEWFDDKNQSLLAITPHIRLLPQTDTRPPRPITYQEETLLLDNLPPHLKNMTIFALNTGCRSGEICALKWKWEYKIEGFKSLFIIPGENHKNGDDKIVVLNSKALKIINDQRGKHPAHVFTYKNNPINRMNNSAWRTMREKTGLTGLRVHDLRHTFGSRLRAAGIPLETRQELLGHRCTKITTHYSAVQIQELYNAVTSIEIPLAESPTLITLKRRAG